MTVSRHLQIKTSIQIGELINDAKVFGKMFDVFLTRKKILYMNVLLSADSSFLSLSNDIRLIVTMRS